MDHAGGYQLGNTLNDLHTLAGASGGSSLDKVRILFIEGDAGTTLADLQGVGASTTGNWVGQVQYPIIEDASMTTLYGIAYYPTIFKICPDGKQLYEMGQIPTEELLDEILEPNCAVPNASANDAGLIVDAEFDLCNELGVTLINLGSDTLRNIDFIINGNGGTTPVSTFSWAGELGPLELETIPFAFAFDNLISQFDSLYILADNPGDASPANNTATVKVNSIEVATPNVTIELRTDDYGSETSWELVDESGAIIASSLGFTFSNNTLYTHPISLADFGCYQLNVFDSYGDGICCSYGNGYYKLLDNAGNTLLEGGEFLLEDSRSFNYSCNGGAQVSGLQSIVGSPRIKLKWDAVPNSIGCKVEGRPLGGSTLLEMNVYGPEVDFVKFLRSSVSPGVYEWRVRCACDFSPLLTTQVSDFEQFVVSSAAAAKLSTEPALVLPNPADDFMRLENASGLLRVYNADGKLMFESLQYDGASIAVGNWPTGLYWYDLQKHSGDSVRGKFVKQ